MSTFNIYAHATQKQIDSFVPTYLYIKQHTVTGVKYFGMTKRNPIRYRGSGTYWLRHIKHHGKHDIETVWFCLFTDIHSLVETAITLSENMDVVKSDEWANLVPEFGTGNTTNSEIFGKWWNSLTAEKRKEINEKKVRCGEKNGMFGSVRTGEKNGMFGKKQSEFCRQATRNANLGKTTIINESGESVRISTHEYDPTTMKHPNKNKGIFVDIYGNTVSAHLDDIRVISGELVHVNKGKKRTPEQKQHLSDVASSLKWYNNGVRSVRSSVPLGDDWKPGRIGWKK